MGALPTSDVGPTVTGTLSAPFTTQDITLSPAIAQLWDMYQRGLVTNEQLQELRNNANTKAQTDVSDINRKNQLNAEDIEQSKSNMANIPIRSRAEAARAQQFLDVAPSSTAAQINTNELVPKANRYKETVLGAQQPGADLAKTEAEQAPSGWQSEARDMYQSIVGKPLMKADGSYDYEGMNTAIAPFRSARVTAQMMTKNPQWDALVDAAKQKGDYTALANVFSGKSTMTDELNRLGNSPPAATREELGQFGQGVISAGTAVSKMSRANSILANNPGIFGAARGSGLGQGIERGAAVVGIEKAKQDRSDRQEMYQSLGQGILDAIKSLAGTGNRVMKAELEQMNQVQPKEDATADVWKRWLKEKQTALVKGLTYQKETAPGSATKSQLDDIDRALASVKSLDFSTPEDKSISTITNSPGGFTATPNPGTTSQGATPPKTGGWFYNSSAQ